MTTKADTYRALLLDDFEPSPGAYFAIPPSPAAAPEPVAVELPEPRVSKQAFAGQVGMSVRWVEQKIAAGLPCEYIDGRPRLRVSEGEDWLREHGHLTTTQTRERSGATA